MKTAFTLISLFVTSLSYAGPTVGDQVTYSATSTQGSNTTSFVVTDQITAIDPVAQIVSVLQNTLLNGASVGSQTNQSPMSDVYYPTAADIANCASQNTTGQTASITKITVAAGTFQACHVVVAADSSGNSSEYYTAAVPFGFVKSISTSTDGVMTTELTAFKQN